MSLFGRLRKKRSGGCATAICATDATGKGESGRSAGSVASSSIGGATGGGPFDRPHEKRSEGSATAIGATGATEAGKSEESASSVASVAPVAVAEVQEHETAQNSVAPIAPVAVAEAQEKKTEALVASLADAGISLKVEGETLRAGPPQLVTAELAEAIRANKAAILDYLKAEAEQEDFEERAAILEYDAELSRPEAERTARYLVRERDPHNVAGWRVRESSATLEELQAEVGDGFEVKLSPCDGMKLYRCRKVGGKAWATVYSAQQDPAEVIAELSARLRAPVEVRGE